MIRRLIALLRFPFEYLAFRLLDAPHNISLYGSVERYKDRVTASHLDKEWDEVPEFQEAEEADQNFLRV